MMQISTYEIDGDVLVCLSWSSGKEHQRVDAMMMTQGYRKVQEIVTDGNAGRYSAEHLYTRVHFHDC